MFNMFMDTSKTPKEKRIPPLTWTDMNEQLKEASKKIEVRKKVVRQWLGQEGWLREDFFSAKEELRESLLSIWRVDIHKALRM